MADPRRWSVRAQEWNPEVNDCSLARLQQERRWMVPGQVRPSHVPQEISALVVHENAGVIENGYRINGRGRRQAIRDPDLVHQVFDAEYPHYCRRMSHGHFG
jgi:hypothetical protein